MVRRERKTKKDERQMKILEEFTNWELKEKTKLWKILEQRRFRTNLKTTF